MLWRMPGTIRAGARVKTLTQVVSFANSLLAFVGSFDVEAGSSGYSLPDVANSPGVSYAHLLRNVSSLMNGEKASTRAAAVDKAPDGWHRIGRAEMTDASMRGLHFGEYGQVDCQIYAFSVSRDYSLTYLLLTSCVSGDLSIVPNMTVSVVDTQRTQHRVQSANHQGRTAGALPFAHGLHGAA
jgi:hypothetical protein